MHSDYNESTRRFRNPRRIEDFWDQQGKFAHGKEVAAIFVAASMLWLDWVSQRKECLMFASVVDDVATYGEKQQKDEVLVIGLIKEAWKLILPLDIQVV